MRKHILQYEPGEYFFDNVYIHTHTQTRTRKDADKGSKARMHVRTHRDRKKTHARRSQEEDSACVGKKTHCWRAR